MRNIVLCGFMGSGKTTLGQLLAQRLNLPFLDSDDVIEEREGMKIPEIFAKYGEPGFRDREHAAILFLAERKGMVLSTGGGALTFSRNVPPLQKNGVIVYLNPGFDACYQRIVHSDRPLVRANTREQMRDLYDVRDPKYREACQVEVSMEGTPEEWAAAVLRECGME